MGDQVILNDYGKKEVNHGAFTGELLVSFGVYSPIIFSSCSNYYISVIGDVYKWFDKIELFESEDVISKII